MSKEKSAGRGSTIVPSTAEIAGPKYNCSNAGSGWVRAAFRLWMEVLRRDSHRKINAPATSPSRGKYLHVFLLLVYSFCKFSVQLSLG